MAIIKLKNKKCLEVKKNLPSLMGFINGDAPYIDVQQSNGKRTLIMKDSISHIIEDTLPLSKE